MLSATIPRATLRGGPPARIPRASRWSQNLSKIKLGRLTGPVALSVLQRNPGGTKPLSDGVVAPLPTTSTPLPRERCGSRRLRGEAFGLSAVHLSHQYGFRDGTLWCWKCGGWSTGSRRQTRLKDQREAATNAGADVVHRVSGGNPPRVRTWDPNDVSQALERIPIVRNPCCNRYRPQVAIQDNSSR